MNGKKGISLEFFAAFIFAVLLFTVAGVAFARMLSGADSTAYNSYEDFVKNVVSISGAESGTQDSQMVSLYKDGALIGFNKESYLRFYYAPKSKSASGGMPGILALVNLADYYQVWKPDECGDADSCVCACSRIELVEKPGLVSKQFQCGGSGNNKVDCTKQDVTYAKAYKECNAAVTLDCVAFTTNGGFIMGALYDSNDEHGRPVRSSQRGTTFENYRGVVGVCTGLPCMTSDEKKRVDAGILLRRAAYACIAGETCSLKEEIARAIAPTERKDWKLRLERKTLEVPTTLSSLRFRLENSGFEEISYLIENSQGFTGPFREIKDKAPFPFDEMNSTPWYYLKVYVVMADPVTGNPQWDTKKENYDLEFEQSQDTVKVTDKSGILGWVAGKSYALIDVVNTFDVPVDHPPYPLVFVVKE
jgi:hypothetical protein